MTQKDQTARLTRGQLVEVLGPLEILATLDMSGAHDGMPFMPEMLRHCGKRLRIERRADKTCVEGFGMRSLENTVFLEDLRCDGQAHDGCERDCLTFWKEAWVRPIPESDASKPSIIYPESDFKALKARLITKRAGRYTCQSTALATATGHMSRSNIVHFFREIRDGELSYPDFIRIVARVVTNRIRSVLRMPLLDVLIGPNPRNSKGRLNLIEGEWVEVLSEPEILKTVDPRGRNAGLSFEPDMRHYIGKRFRVKKKITKIIREETGEMVNISNTVALEGNYCKGICAKNCPRANPHYWREAWLKRVEAQQVREPDEIKRA